ncbi:MAG: hypothetical protein KIT44_12835 [Opitutaceae bacterium]|nr:hypothetical protein [Opitutaceae bacterium]
MPDSLGAPLPIGTRREPFFDRGLIEKLRHISHELVDSVQTENEFSFDRPWEGPYSSYPTIINDGGLYRMYYRGQSAIKAPSFTCYAESSDGKNWVRPKLGLHPFAGRIDTNILLVDQDPNEKTTHNFTPFLDLNPAVNPKEKYKAVAGDDKHGLWGYASADGIHWQRIQPAAVFRDGVFDSQNITFWSEAENCYVLYFRVWTEGLYKGKRTIARTTSADFRTWTKPEQMAFGDVPLEELYTNVTMPCPGAPHLYVALPSRFVMKRQWMSSELARSLTVQEGREADVSDTVFMTSRGGTVYERHFPAAYLKPGLDPQDWVGRNNMVTAGLVELDGGTTWGFYRSRHYASASSKLTLHTLRRDGFARLRAGRKTGRVLTKPFVAAGDNLCLNFATSAAGTLRIDVLDAGGKPIAGFSGRAAARLFGDSTHFVVPWSKQRGWSELNGRAIRLRFTLQEADLYALQQIRTT